MRNRLIIVLILHLLTTSCFAGFGRDGSSGRSSSSSSRNYSARSYSAPVYRSYSQSRTVVHEYHNNSSNSNNDGGIHPLVAGMAGYMVGDALNHHNGSAVAAQPQAVYAANAQTQQVQQSIPQQPFQYADQTPVLAEDHGAKEWIIFILFIVAIIVIIALII